MVVIFRSGLDDHLGAVVDPIGAGTVSISSMGNDSAIMIRNFHSTLVYVVGLERQGERVDSEDTGDFRVLGNGDLLLQSVATSVVPSSKVIVRGRNSLNLHRGSGIHNIFIRGVTRNHTGWESVIHTVQL